MGSFDVRFAWIQARLGPRSTLGPAAAGLLVTIVAACSASVTPHPRLGGPSRPPVASAVLPPVAKRVPRGWSQQAPDLARARRWQPWQANTLSTQILMAPVGLAGGVLAGAIAASVLLYVLPDENAALVIGFGVGLGTGVSASTWLTGAAYGGTGRWAPTWAAGALPGGAAAAMLVFFGGGESVGAWGLAAMMTGPILAYHTSATEMPPPTPQPTNAWSLQWAPPTMAPTFDRAGRVAGWQLNLLQGRF